MSKWIHRLRGLNETNKTAICEFCGPVPVRKKKNIWRCALALNALKTREKRISPNKSRVQLATACEICSTECKLVYDHCHKLGHFRGWLCHGCNVMLGFAKDDPEILQKAIEYLKERGGSN